ncbi:hypothetical protein, partial [Desulfogranum japonicum]|uniref:hypothetical protein n=1 Tax=Desulfogranum japonicum TaxID=231447 RepID=UPI00048BC84C
MHVAILRSLLHLIVIFFFLSTSAYADLGLSSSDFGSQSVDGSQVDGVQVHSLDDQTNDTSDQSDGATADGSDDDSGSTGAPGTNSPVCPTNQGNGQDEGSSCKECADDSTSGSCNPDDCETTHSNVNIITREYQDDLIDMSVKVAGGYAKVYRLYVEGKWQFEHEFNRIQTTAQENVLRKGNINYTKGTDGIYHFKTFTLQPLDTGYRWQNKKGKYVLYDQQGRMVETGDRRGILTKYTYQGKQLHSITDRHNTPVYTFTYNAQGKISQAADQHERTVSYLWENDLLTTFTDVRGHNKRYSYSKNGQLTAKAD